MPACPRDKQHSTLPPPGFSDANATLKNEQLIELLEKVIDKCRHEPQFVAQQSKQTDLLVSSAQFFLISTPMSSNDNQDFLNNIVTITQDLLIDENNKEIVSSIDSCPLSNENKATTSTILPSDPTNNDDNGDFSLDDLANEYLQNEPTPSSLNDKPTTSSESEEPNLTLDLPSSPSTPSSNVISTLVFPSSSNEPVIIKPLLDSILFSNRLSSQDAADDADCIWKEESSPLGQIFCIKSNEMQTIATKRISTCLLDRSLYERLARLIILLPKQCIRNSIQQSSIQHNEKSNRPPRPNNDHRRPLNRPSFQQNSVQSHPAPRYPTAQNPRYHSNPHYPNQQGNLNGYYVDRRSQQQNRYPPSSFASYPADQQKGPPKNNSYHNNNNNQQQQQKKPQTNNQQASNQYQQQRGTKKGSGGGGGGGGNKSTNDKSGAFGSGPSSNPK